MRVVVLVLALLLVVCAPAVAQDAVGPDGGMGQAEGVEEGGEAGTPRQEEEGDDEDVDDGVDYGVDNEADDEGGDEDEPGCEAAGTDGDYVYCPEAQPGGGGGRRLDKRTGPAASAAQTLPATLPLTGQNPIIIALIGLGFVMIGAGARLQLRSRG